MKNENKEIDSWIVIRGYPIFVCRTRRQARAYIKKNKPTGEKDYNYIGKCVKNYRQIVLEI